MSLLPYNIMVACTLVVRCALKQVPVYCIVVYVKPIAYFFGQQLTVPEGKWPWLNVVQLDQAMHDV